MIKIRRIGINEVIKYRTELINLIHMNIIENYPECDVKKNVDAFYEKMKEYSCDGSAILLGAFEDDIIVGFYWAHISFFLGEKRMHVYLNAVNSSYRRQGIGSAFLKELQKIAKTQNIQVLEAFCRATNDDAMEYYRHNGFEIENYRIVKKINDDVDLQI